MRNATISFVMSVLRLSILGQGTTRLPLEGFSLNLTLEYISNICLENSSFIAIWQYRELYRKTYLFLITSRTFLHRMRNVSVQCRANQNTHFVFSKLFSPKLCFYDVKWKNMGRAGQAIGNNMAHANCMLDTWSYKQTLRIYNIFCFSSARMVARTRPNIKLYVCCLPYFWNLLREMFEI